MTIRKWYYIYEFGAGKLVKQKPITEFDDECRWWIVPPLTDLSPNVELVKNISRHDFDAMAMCHYKAMTDLPVNQAMFYLAVDGDSIEIAFAPKVVQKFKPKAKDFGRENK